MVWADPGGFAVDWDWQLRLTVWELAGPRFESRFDRKVLEYELPAQPPSERRARAVAGRWWRSQGRLKVAQPPARPAVRPPAHDSHRA